jgi:hypothetical protein
MCRRALSYRTAKHATVCKHANVYARRQQLNYVTISYPIDQHKILPIHNFHFVVYINAEGMRHLGKLETDTSKSVLRSRESKCVLDSTVWGWDSVDGFCEHCNEVDIQRNVYRDIFL